MVSPPPLRLPQFFLVSIGLVSVTALVPAALQAQIQGEGFYGNATPPLLLDIGVEEPDSFAFLCSLSFLTGPSVFPSDAFPEHYKVLSYPGMLSPCISRGYAEPNPMTDGKSLSVKFLAPSSSPQCARAVVDEARALMTLNHPNIVKAEAVYFGRMGVSHVLFKPPRDTVENFLYASDSFELGALTRENKVDFARAVQLLHSKGIAHRNIRASSVGMFQGSEGIHSWTLKLMDFGCAGNSGECAVQTMPELAPPVPAHTFLAEDVWDLGVLLFRIERKARGWKDADLNIVTPGIVDVMMNRRFLPKVEISGSVPDPDFRALMVRMLDPNPKTRATMDEVLMSKWMDFARDSGENSSLAGPKPLITQSIARCEGKRSLSSGL